MYQQAQSHRTSKQGRIQQVTAGVAAVREAVVTRLATLDGRKVAVGLAVAGVIALGLAELQPAHAYYCEWFCTPFGCVWRCF